MAAPAQAPPAKVLTDVFLFRHITAFQHGLAMPLFEFWRVHKPADVPLAMNARTSRKLVELLLDHGTPGLFAMAERARFLVTRRVVCATSPPDPSRCLVPKNVASVSLSPLPLEGLADSAVRCNRVDIAEWALASKRFVLQFPSDAWTDAIERACDDGSTRMLDVLREHTLLQTHVINNVNVNPEHIDVMRWLLGAFPNLRVTPEMVALAVNQGELEVLQMIHTRGFKSRSRIQIDGVLSMQNIEVLTFFLEHFHRHVDPLSLWYIVSDPDPAISQVVLRLADRLQAGCVAHMTSDCSRLETVQRWVDQGILSPKWPISIDTIASCRSLDIVRLLHNHGIATATTNAMDGAAERAKWKTVEFLHYNRSEGCTTRAMDAAVQQGNLKYVLFLLHNRTEGFSSKAAEKAVSGLSRSTETLRYLHSHTNVQFTPAVMDTAAACGNLVAVKFLHENRSEGCTIAAMDRAAGNGFLEVVEYLHTHRSEGCTFAALEQAIQGGKLDVVHFLFDNYRHLFELATFNKALVNRVVSWGLRHEKWQPVVQLFVDHFSQSIDIRLRSELLVRGWFDTYLGLRHRPSDQPEDAILESALYQAGRTFELRTIRFVIEVLGRRDLAYQAMDGAVNAEACGTHWLRAVYAVTGPQSCRLSAVRSAIEHARYRSCPLDRVKYLIRICCDPNPKQAVMESLGMDAAIAAELAHWEPTPSDDVEASQQPLHPFLLDPRVKGWTVRYLFECPANNSPNRQSWAVRAAYEHDTLMLDVIRDTQPTPDCTHVNHGVNLDADHVKKCLSFDGAQAAAIVQGSLAMLQWLLKHADLPVEPTLLSVALFSDQRDIAEWLAVHHPAACTEVGVDATPIALFHRMRSGFFSEDQLDWLKSTPAVRRAPAFDRVVDVLLRRGDALALRRLHAFDPSLVTTRRGLLALATQLNCAAVVEFLHDIQYVEA